MIRTRAQRIADTLAALDRETECWVSVGRASGVAHMIPLTFVWDGERVVISTSQRSITANAVRRTGKVRLSLPSTSDVVIIDAWARLVTINQIDATTHSLFRQVAGFNPRASDEPYVYLLLTPERVLAWRHESELPHREIMSAGIWSSGI